MRHSSEQDGWLGYALLAAGVLTLSIAGYVGYTIYPRFNLPPVSGVGLYVLATAAGLGAFFSPCSFPLLATLLARSIGSTSNEKGTLENALRYGAALAAGASAFLLVTGVAIAFGGGALFSQVTFTSTPGRILRIAIGSLLVFLGLVQAGAVSFPFDRIAELAVPVEKAQGRLRRERPVLGFGLFGFGYILAGFG
jgi:cytochrome c-type biogenesis protein